MSSTTPHASPDLPPMRFGIGYWSQAANRLRPRHHVLLYDELIRDAQLAESLGFADYWLVEHHFWYDGHGNALMTSLGAIAAETKSIGIGTSMLLLPMHDPLRVAEMAGTVDQLSGGRLRLAFGLGYRDEEYDGLGVSRRTRGKRTDESLAFLQQTWADDGPFTFSGRHVAYEGEVDPQPRPVRPPSMYLGGFVPQTAVRAAKFGCGLQLGPALTAEQGGELVSLFHETGREFGVDTSGREIGICRDFWIAPTMEQARSVGRPRLFHYYGETVALGWKLFRDETGAVIGPDDRPEMLAAYATGAVNAGIIGDPDHVTEEITRLQRAGFNYVQLRLRFDSQPYEMIRDAATLFAEEVMPRFGVAD